MALSGSTSIMHLDIDPRSVETQDADTFGLVVMTSGGNDLIHNYGRTPPREGAMYGATLRAGPAVDRKLREAAERDDRAAGEQVFPAAA